MFSKCAKALNGTALLVVELVAPLEFAVRLEVDALAESAFRGGVKVLADGVYRAEVVRALEPAAAAPEEANDEDAPAPDAPAEALD